MSVHGSLLCDWHKLHSTSCGNPKPLPDFFLQILVKMSRGGGGVEWRVGKCAEYVLVVISCLDILILSISGTLCLLHHINHVWN